MTTRFTDKAMIITGAGSGLGQAVAERLAADGANLVLVDMNSEGLGATKQLVHQEHGDVKIELVTADVTKEEDVKKYVDAAVSALSANRTSPRTSVSTSSPRLLPSTSTAYSSACSIS